MVLIMAKVEENITRITADQWYLNSSTSGTFTISLASLASSKTSGSCRWRRIQKAMPVRAMLIQKGTRQPQVSSCSSGSEATGMKTRVASTMPNMIPLMVKLAKKERR